MRSLHCVTMVKNEQERANRKGWQVEKLLIIRDPSLSGWFLMKTQMPGALSAISVTHRDSPNQPALLWMNI